MVLFRPGEVAGLLGVSVDTVRRWVDEGRVPSRRTAGGRRVVEGADLAAFLEQRGGAGGGADAQRGGSRQSARNRFRGIVTRVEKDGVAAQVEIRCGPHRIVSLMTREAADELGIVPGMVAVASMKATSVVVEVPAER